MVDRLHGMQEVAGSNPVESTLTWLQIQRVQPAPYRIFIQAITGILASEFKRERAPVVLERDGGQVIRRDETQRW